MPARDPVRPSRTRLAAIHALLIGAFLAAACAPAPPLAAPLPPARTHLVEFETTEGTHLTFDLTPDGEAVVFDLLGQLWRVPTAGGVAVALTDAVAEVAEDLDPVVSPDGEWIVFQGDRPGGRALWLMPAAGGEARKLTSRLMTYFVYATPAWSPDGRRIAYAVEDTLAIIDLETGVELAPAIDSLPPATPAAVWVARAGMPAWSPDGARLAFVNGRGDGRIWEMPSEGGAARPLTQIRAQGPAYSPAGDRLAFFARDDANRFQVWVQRLEGGEPQRLTDHDEVIPVRVRWTPDGAALVYSADGGLWHVRAGGGAPEPIPFRARFSFQRRQPAAPHVVRFPDPGTEHVARGFTDIALSPDGRTVALIALDSLWLVRPGERPRAIASAERAHWGWSLGMTWSPDGREIAWGRYGGGDHEELVAADVHSGEVRTLARLEGGFYHASWSPDGAWIAFVGLPSPGHLRLIEAYGPAVETLEDTKDLGPAAIAWGTLAWSAESDALIAAELPIREPGDRPARAFWIPLEGEPRRVERFPNAPSQLHMYPDGRAVYVESNLLWEAPFAGAKGLQGTPRPLVDHPAVEARYAANGSILYLSADGLRIRGPNGGIEVIGWPLRYRTPDPPPPLLIRGGRVIDGTGAPASQPRDILIRGGRIERIAAAHTLTAENARVVDAGGAWIIPGMIDLHAHIWDDLFVLSSLHNGVTTLRDISSQRIRTPDIRNSIYAGVRAGPRIVYAAGMFHGGRWGHSTLTNQLLSDKAGVERGMAIMAGIGSEYIKERSFSDWWGAVNVVLAAHAYGLPVSGHCTHILPIVAAGMTGREHTSGCYRDWSVLRRDFPALLDAAGQWLVSTNAYDLSRLHLIDDRGMIDAEDVGPFVPAGRRAFFAPDSAAAEALRPRLVRAIERGVRPVGAFHQAGVLLAAGSDNPLPLRMQHEMEALVRGGLSPHEAILAATAHAARVLNAPDIGTIEVGSWGDLLILDGDPLEDIRNTRRIRKVVLGGQIVDRAALRAEARR
jgi:imidazolonepropionase-like amidohydrolase/Tol biopolymer transport system component